MQATETNGTTAIVVRDNRENTALAPSEVLAPMSWHDMVRMGDDLVRTGFLPESVKNGAQAAAIILAAREMGIPQMKAFRTLYIFKGKIDEYADSQLARFKAKGGRASFIHDTCDFVGCKVKPGAPHLDAEHASIRLRHPNGDEHIETFTMADAKNAGLTSVNTNYQKNPKPMLRSRAITGGLKSLGWEDAVGNYDPSEIDTFATEVVPHPGSSAPRTQVTVKVDAPQPSQSYRPSETQSAKLKAALDELGIGKVEAEAKNREAYLSRRQAYMAEVNGGAMPTSNTETEALISELEGRVKCAREQDDSAEASVIDAPPNG